MASSLLACAPTSATIPARVIRRIAPNVIAICSEDATPVVNPKRPRGRWPAGITWIWSRPRLCVGDFAELTGACSPANRGKLVEIINLASPRNGETFWLVRGVHQPLVLGSSTTGATVEFRREAPAAASNLRRCRNP